MKPVEVVYDWWGVPNKAPKVGDGLRDSEGTCYLIRGLERLARPDNMPMVNARLRLQCDEVPYTDLPTDEKVGSWYEVRIREMG